MTRAVQDYINSLNWGYRVALRENGVTYENAYGEFVEPHKIKVGVWQPPLPLFPVREEVAGLLSQTLP